MKAWAVLLLAGSLLGCAGPRYGVYAQLDSANSARMAIDASNVLPRVYSPAMTRFNVEQRATDQFGNTLIGLLRQKGYAVSESPLYWSAFHRISNAPGFSFNYVIDQVDEQQSRLTLVVEGSTISRLYRNVNGISVPVGFWAKKE